MGERRGNWVKTLQEYDLEFKLDTVIKGEGICMLMVVSKNNEDEDWENEAKLHIIDMCPIFTALEYWYIDVIHYLQQGYVGTTHQQSLFDRGSHSDNA